MICIFPSSHRSGVPQEVPHTDGTTQIGGLRKGMDDSGGPTPVIGILAKFLKFPLGSVAALW